MNFFLRAEACLELPQPGDEQAETLPEPLQAHPRQAMNKGNLPTPKAGLRPQGLWSHSGKGPDAATEAGAIPGCCEYRPRQGRRAAWRCTRAWGRAFRLGWRTCMTPNHWDQNRRVGKSLILPMPLPYGRIPFPKANRCPAEATLQRPKREPNPAKRASLCRCSDSPRSTSKSLSEPATLMRLST